MVDNVIVAYALAVCLLVGGMGYLAFHQIKVDNQMIEQSK